MLRRLAISAALAALALPVAGTVGLTAAPSQAADPDSFHSDDAAQRADHRKAVQSTSARTAQTSRRAKRAGARAEDDTPLSVTIDQLTPSTMPDKGMVRVSGTVTNNDTVTWGTINLRPFVSADPLTSPEQLEAAAATPADAVVGDRINDERYKYFIEELAPGDTQPYSFSIPRSALHADSPGVYWFGVHALGENDAGRDEFADGRARTFLPLVPSARLGQEPTAVVIPIRHQLLYADDGSLDDLEGWTQTLSQGGRLRSLVDFGASSGDATVTWVIDPAVVDAVRRLAAGNPPRSLEANLRAGQEDGEDEGDDQGDDQGGSATEEGTGSAESSEPTGQPTETPSPTTEPEAESPLDLDELDPLVQTAAEAARAWLARLGEAMRPEDQVMTLPYGDVDVSSAVERDPQLYQRATARAGTTLPGFDVTTTPVVSSPGGFLSTKGIRGTDPAATVLITDAMFGEHLGKEPPSLATTEGRDVVVTSTGAAEGGPGPDERTAMTAMRQRLLSEAAVRYLQQDHAPLTFVLPHDWNPSAGGPSFFAGLATDWVNLTSVRGVEGAATPEPVDGNTLRYPAWQSAAEIDQEGFDAADALIRSGAALQNLLTLNNLVSGTVTDQALGTTSYSARTRPIANRSSAERSRAWISQRLAQVLVTAPDVILSSTSGQFAATVINGLDQPVTVSLDAVSDDRLTISGPRRVEVGANQRASVLLTARTNENGLHDVRLLVTDKRGTPLGATTTLSIRAAQVSNIIWLFLAIGAALLFGAIGMRLYRRVRDARRAPAATDAGDDSAEDDPERTSDSSEDPDPDKEPAEVGTR